MVDVLIIIGISCLIAFVINYFSKTSSQKLADSLMGGDPIHKDKDDIIIKWVKWNNVELNACRQILLFILWVLATILATMLYQMTM